MCQFFSNQKIKLYLGDVLDVIQKIETQSVQVCITSPPYWGLRRYTEDISKQIGCQSTPFQYIDKLTKIFQQVNRILKKDGTLWLNIGDSYVSKPTGSLGNHTGSKYGFGQNHKHQTNASKRIDKTGFGMPQKNLIGIPWRLAFSLQNIGYILRQDIIWQKNAMPESVKDRCTKSHQYLFLLSKSQKYYFDHQSMQVPLQENLYQQDLFGEKIQVKTANMRDVWYIPTEPTKSIHVAPFPTKLVQNCILAGSKQNDTVLDIFNGSGTTGLVSLNNNRKYIGIDISQQYLELTKERLGFSNENNLF